MAAIHVRSSLNNSLKYFLSFLLLITILAIVCIIFTESAADLYVYEQQFATRVDGLSLANIGARQIVQGDCGHRGNCLTEEPGAASTKITLIPSIKQHATSLGADVQTSYSHSTSVRNYSQIVTNELSGQPRPAEERDAWWDTMMHIQKERKHHLRTTCQDKYGQNTLPLSEFAANNKNLYSFYVVDKFKLLYSFVHKVGSSNWSKMFHRINPTGNLRRLYTLPTNEALWRLNEYSSFIIVRHPLARLLSAYKDKFVQHHIPHFKSIGRSILKRFRSNVTQSQLQNPIDVTFEEFLRYLVANDRNRGNTHWDHIIIRNKVCLFDYDIIAKLETGREDTQLILKTFNMEKIADLGSEYTNYTGKRETMRSYYSQIPPSLLQEIFRIYESDFLLFNYSMSVP